MAKDKSEKIKLYVVIGLSVVAAVMAYFRFVHKPGRSGPSATDAPQVATAFEIPELPDGLHNTTTLVPDDALYSTPLSRDLFAPADDPPAPAPGQTPTRPGASGGLPELTAIIKGAKGALAVLDGEIVQAGKTIGPYRVLEIGKRHVVLLTRDGKRFTLNTHN